MQNQEVKTEVKQEAPVVADASAAKKKIVRKRNVKKEQKVTVVKSKRKESIARAYVKSGSGRIRVNGKDISAVESDFVRSIILEPINLLDTAKLMAKKLDIEINVHGGGVSSQMQAARGAIAKGIVEFSGNDALRKEYLKYDRSIIVDDPRRVEPKKPMGTKARAKFQTSYR